LTRKIIVTLLFLSSLLRADFFEKESLSLGIVAGAGSSNNDNYFIAGLSGDYFILDGLSVGGAYRGWFGADPSQHQLTLSSSYYLSLSNKYHPYFGVFTRETFIDKDDYNSYGGRVGLAMTMSRNSYVSVGYAYEKYTNCKEILIECSSAYPEFVFSLSF